MLIYITSVLLSDSVSLNDNSFNFMLLLSVKAAESLFWYTEGKEARIKATKHKLCRCVMTIKSLTSESKLNTIPSFRCYTNKFQALQNILLEFLNSFGCHWGLLYSKQCCFFNLSMWRQLLSAHSSLLVSGTCVKLKAARQVILRGKVYDICDLNKRARGMILAKGARVHKFTQILGEPNC